jgi:L-ascorbate metabolism protein UlaG (beta-lactamase superfamily)
MGLKLADICDKIRKYNTSMAKITWAGQSCFQISVSNSKDHEANIVIDPFDEKIGLKVPNFSADILLVTHDHYDHNNIKAIKGDPFLIKGPGEYEIKGVFIRGIPSSHDDSEGKERGQNTIYAIEAEEIKFCHLGDLGQKQLTDEQLELIDGVDVLMIPVGGTFTISFSEAQKIISQIEPKIIIPMHYALPKLKIDLDDVGKFLKTMGKNSIVPQDKFTIKQKDLPKEGAMEIVVLQP